MRAKASHIFISHGSRDHAAATEIADDLEARGLTVWIAPRDVRPGQDYSEQLQQAIERCGAFLVLVTEESNKSPYVRVETEMAFSNNKPLFPVRMADVAPGAGLAFFLKIKHWTDAFGPHRERNLHKLGDELDSIIGAAGGAEGAGAAAEPPAPVPAPPAPTRAAPAPPEAPIAEPAPSAAETAHAGGDERLRAYVGSKADYYLPRWRRMDERGSSISWNWPAFLLSIFWLAFRKMWLAAIVAALGFAVLVLLGALVPDLALATNVLVLAAAAAIGVYGNSLYKAQAEKAVAADGGGESQSLDRVRLSGGTSLPAALGLAAAWVALVSVPVLLNAPTLAGGGGTASGNMASPAPAPGPGPEPKGDDPDAPEAPPAVDLDYLEGRWAEANGAGCAAEYLEFRRDGTFAVHPGGEGTWALDGDTIIARGPNGDIIGESRVVPIDRYRFNDVSQDGTTTVLLRCQS